MFLWRCSWTNIQELAEKISSATNLFTGLEAS